MLARIPDRKRLFDSLFGRTQAQSAQRGFVDDGVALGDTRVRPSDVGQASRQRLDAEEIEKIEVECHRVDRDLVARFVPLAANTDRAAATEAGRSEQRQRCAGQRSHAGQTANLVDEGRAILRADHDDAVGVHGQTLAHRELALPVRNAGADGKNDQRCELDGHEQRLAEACTYGSSRAAQHVHCSQMRKHECRPDPGHETQRHGDREDRDEKSTAEPRNSDELARIQERIDRRQQQFRERDGERASPRATMPAASMRNCSASAAGCAPDCLRTATSRTQ